MLNKKRKRNFKFGYTKQLSKKSDERYSLVWAKKIRAINLLGGKCKLCGTEDIFVLDFHHIIPNGGKIECQINQLLRHQVSWLKLKAEVEKCELLCRNCHAEFHHPKIDREYSTKDKLLKIKGEYSCKECGYFGKSFSSLEFHHRNPKEKDFRMSLNCSLAKQLDEIEKCDVICKNCHGKKHIDIKKFERLKEFIYEKVALHRGYGDYSNCDIKVIERLYCENGLSIRMIGQQLHSQGDIVKKVIEENKLVRGLTYENLRPEEKSIMKLRAAGDSLRVISIKVGCSKYKVLYTLRKLKKNNGGRWFFGRQKFRNPIDLASSVADSKC